SRALEGRGTRKSLGTKMPVVGEGPRVANDRLQADLGPTSKFAAVVLDRLGDDDALDHRRPIAWPKGKGGLAGIEPVVGPHPEPVLALRFTGRERKPGENPIRRKRSVTHVFPFDREGVAVGIRYLGPKLRLFARLKAFGRDEPHDRCRVAGADGQRLAHLAPGGRTGDE